MRVNLMYGSGRPGKNKCTSGGYDDTDDLVISVKPNPIAASMAVSNREERRDDAEAAIAEMMHDERADQEAAALLEMKGSVRNGDGEDGSSTSKTRKSNAGKEAADAADSKYVCDKHRPLDSTICEEGGEADNKCSYEGEDCGGRGKKCHFAECSVEEASV